MENKNDTLIKDLAFFLPEEIMKDYELGQAYARELDFYGYKYADGEELYQNAFIDLRLVNKKDKTPLGVGIFKGANYRENDVSLVFVNKRTMEEDYLEVFKTSECLGENSFIMNKEEEDLACIIEEHLEKNDVLQCLGSFVFDFRTKHLGDFYLHIDKTKEELTLDDLQELEEAIVNLKATLHLE